MAFPVIESVTGGNTNTNATNHTVNLPSGIVANNMIVIAFCSDGAPTITFPAGWFSLFEQANGANVKFGVWYRIADGTEGATITVTTSALERTAHTSYRLSTTHAWQIACGTAATGTSTTPDPPSFTPPFGAREYVWLSVCGYDYNRTISAYPTDYTDGRNDYANNTAGCGAGTARRSLNTTTQDPSTFTISASDQWVANVIAIENAAIDVGTEALNRAGGKYVDYTQIDYNNAANLDGTINTVNIWTVNNFTAAVVGLLADGGGGSFTGRDSEVIGAVTAGAARQYTGLTITCVTGDFIGVYDADGGQIESATSGFSGVYESQSAGNKLATTANYDIYAGDCISLNGTGVTTAATIPFLTLLGVGV